MNSPKTQIATIIAVTVASLIGIPYFQNQRIQDSPIAKRREEFKSLSEREQDRIVVNFETYQDIESNDPQRLEQLQTTHVALSKQPSQMKAATAYREWLGLLPPAQQADIRSIKDMDERFEYVSRLLSKDSIRLENKFGLLAERFPDGIEVSLKDAEAMAKHLELAAEELDWIGGTRENITSERLGQLSQMLADTLNQVRDKATVESINKQGSQIRNIVVLFLLGKYEQRKSPKLTTEQLRDGWEQLPAEKRDELMQLSVEDLNRELEKYARGQDSKQNPKSKYQQLLSGFQRGRFSRTGRNGAGREGNRRPNGDRGRDGARRGPGENGFGPGKGPAPQGQPDGDPPGRPKKRKRPQLDDQ